MPVLLSILGCVYFETVVTSSLKRNLNPSLASLGDVIRV